MEALNLAVGLRSVGPALLVNDAVFGEGLVEELAPVAEADVAEHPLHDDAPGPEPSLGPAPERSGGGALLVGQDLGVGQAAEVVDGVCR